MPCYQQSRALQCQPKDRHPKAVSCGLNVNTLQNSQSYPTTYCNHEICQPWQQGINFTSLTNQAHYVRYIQLVCWSVLQLPNSPTGTCCGTETAPPWLCATSSARHTGPGTWTWLAPAHSRSNCRPIFCCETLRTACPEHGLACQPQWILQCTTNNITHVQSPTP